MAIQPCFAFSLGEINPLSQFNAVKLTTSVYDTLIILRWKSKDWSCTEDQANEVPKKHTHLSIRLERCFIFLLLMNNGANIKF